MKSIVLLVYFALCSFSAYAQEPRSAVACDPQEVNVAQFLLSLKEIGTVHNCGVEVLMQVAPRHPDTGAVDYARIVLFGYDRYRCEAKTLACHESSYEMSLPARCLAAAARPVAHHGRWSYEYDVEDTRMRAFLSYQKNRNNQLVSLSFGHTDMGTFKRQDFLNCEPDIFKRETK